MSPGSAMCCCCLKAVLCLWPSSVCVGGDMYVGGCVCGEGACIEQQLCL